MGMKKNGSRNTKEVSPLEQTSLSSQIWKEIKRGYNFIFIKDMPLWVAGIGLGILAILIFLWRYPWGISSGYGNWGNQLYYYLGFREIGRIKGGAADPLDPSGFGYEHWDDIRRNGCFDDERTVQHLPCAAP